MVSTLRSMVRPTLAPRGAASLAALDEPRGEVVRLAHAVGDAHAVHRGAHDEEPRPARFAGAHAPYACLVPEHRLRARALVAVHAREERGATRPDDLAELPLGERNERRVAHREGVVAAAAAHEDAEER